MSITRRQIFEKLTAVRIRELADILEMPGLKGLKKQVLIGKLSRKSSLKPEKVLTEKYKDYILPLIFTKRLCDVFDDEPSRIAEEVVSRKKAFPVLLPSQDERLEIVGTCQCIDEKIQVARTKRGQLQDLFRTLLHKPMTAKIPVDKTDFRC